MRSMNLESKEQDILAMIDCERNVVRMECDIFNRKKLLTTLKKERSLKFKNLRNYCYNIKSRIGFDVLEYIQKNIDKSNDEILDGILTEIDSYKNM